MKIVAISIIRNEADIIETFVRYHLQIVDQMIIVNHRSADSSSKILHKLKEEGLNIEVLEETSIEQPQARALSKIMKKAAYDFAADWIVTLDADEFLTSRYSTDIRKTLEVSSENKIINVPWRTYIPISSNSSELNILKRIQHYRKIEDPQYYKIIIPRLIAMRNTSISHGNHTVVENTLFGKKKFQKAFSEELILSHFPIRTSNQIITKAFVGWLSTLAKPDKGNDEAFHLKQLYDRFREGNGILSPEELTEMALAYGTKSGNFSKDVIFKPVFSPMADFELKYTKTDECNPVKILAQSAEELAEAFSSLRREMGTSILSKLSKKIKG